MRRKIGGPSNDVKRLGAATARSWEPHGWGCRDPGGRARNRGEAAKGPNWPPKIREFVRTMRAEIVVPFGFVPEVRPGKVGPIFELRYYTLKPGTTISARIVRTNSRILG